MKGKQLAVNKMRMCNVYMQHDTVKHVFIYLYYSFFFTFQFSILYTCVLFFPIVLDSV